MEKINRRVRKSEEPVVAGSETEIDTTSEVVVSDERRSRRIIWVVYGVLILLGIGTGYLLSGKKGLLSGSLPGTANQNAVGTADTRVFKDSASGVIERGGLDGEGTHKLIREGGPSQTAYLISTAVDLEAYIGKKVKVYGQTVSAKKAAWLMDVGKIETLAQ